MLKNKKQEALRRIKLRSLVEKRIDDYEDILKRRFEGYERDTKSSVNEMKKTCPVFLIDGLSDQEQVHQNILREVGKLLV